MKEIQKHVISYEPYNDWLCKLKIKGKFNHITLINSYATTEDKIEEIKEQFYEGLQNLTKHKKVIQ
jgi:hypothetical protein